MKKKRKNNYDDNILKIHVKYDQSFSMYFTPSRLNFPSGFMFREYISKVLLAELSYCTA